MQVKGISDLSSDELVQGVIENLSSDSKVYPTLSSDELVQRVIKKTLLYLPTD